MRQVGSDAGQGVVKNRTLKGDLKAIIPTIQPQIAQCEDPEMGITQGHRCLRQEEHLYSNNTRA